MNRSFYIIASLLVLIAFYLIFLRDKARRWSPKWEEGFETFQPSFKVMDLIGIKENMYVGEIGGGNGRFAVKVARRVGDSGKVYANDIDLKAVRFMTQRIEKDNIRNMQVILSRPTNPNFPRNKLDLVYVINTYQYFTNPVRLLSNTKYSLKPDGRLAIVAYDPNKVKKKKKRGVAKNMIIQQAESAGYELMHLDTTSLVYDNIYIFEKRMHGN
jgi:ubiquinone/menaquinone biosynthesis C-methylase UbiE